MTPPPLDQLYSEHGQAVFAFLLALTRNENDTRDILQEIFCQIAARPEILHGIENIRACLIRMAHRRVIDASRRRAVRERHAAEPVSLFAEVGDPDEAAFREALASALLELPEEQRAVVQLKLWSELTFAEIAEALEISANTAASRYRYGLDKMRDVLRPIYEELK